MRSFWRALTAALVVACALALGSRPARAQEQDQAMAQSLFDAGRRLMAQKKYAEACRRFEASEREDPSAGTLLNLGECYEAQGKTATAWARYNRAATMAHASHRTQLEGVAVARAQKLKGHLSKLTIQGPATNIDGLKVLLDSAEVDSASFGTAVAVDPGKHKIEATAPGYKSWSTEVTVGSNGAQATTQIPALEKLPKQPAPATSGAPSSGPSSAAPRDLGTSSHGPSKTLAYVVGGAGVVVLGVGTVFGVLAANQASNAKNDPTLCPNKVCTPAGRQEIDSATTKATISTIGVGVGAAAVATGVVLFLLSPSSSREHPPSQAAWTRVTPVVGPASAGLSLTGNF